jgi:hypothetical protein
MKMTAIYWDKGSKEVERATAAECERVLYDGDATLFFVRRNDYATEEAYQAAIAEKKRCVC